MAMHVDWPDQISLPILNLLTYLFIDTTGTIYPGSRPASVNTRNPRMVTECVLIRSMLVKMYLPFQAMCLYLYIVFTFIQMLTQSI